MAQTRSHVFVKRSPTRPFLCIQHLTVHRRSKGALVLVYSTARARNLNAQFLGDTLTPLSRKTR